MKGDSTAHLVFNRYGQERFLHAIFVPGESGNTLVVSAAEKQAARSAGPAADAVIEIAARAGSQS